MKNQNYIFWENQVYKNGKQVNSFPFTSLVTTLNKFSKPGLSLLEIGCGTGNNFFLYHKLKLLASGSDISSTALKIAKKRFSGNPNFEFFQLSEVEL